MADILFSPIRLDEMEILIEKSVRRAISEMQAAPAIPEDKLLNITEASVLLHLTVPTLYGLVHSQKIPFMKKSKRLYFSREELTAWLRSGRKPTSEIKTSRP